MNDPVKHPRGGNPANRGQYSPVDHPDQGDQALGDSTSQTAIDHAIDEHQLELAGHDTQIKTFRPVSAQDQTWIADHKTAIIGRLKARRKAHFEDLSHLHTVQIFGRQVTMDDRLPVDGELAKIADYLGQSVVSIRGEYQRWLDTCQKQAAAPQISDEQEAVLARMERIQADEMAT